METAGILGIVVRVFADNSAWVRISEGPEEGRDVALTPEQLGGPVQAGQAGRLTIRDGDVVFVWTLGR